MVYASRWCANYISKQIDLKQSSEWQACAAVSISWVFGFLGFLFCLFVLLV